MRHSILVVNDIPFGVYLEKCLGEDYLVMTFTDSDEARREIESGLMYDLALFDLSFPSRQGTDGNVLTRLSKRLHPNIPVLTYSSHTFKSREADGLLDVGASGEITRDTIKSVLENYERRRNPAS